MFLKSEFSNRLVQISLFSALVYYITAYPVVFEKARKYFPVKFKKTHHLLIFHSLVFAVLMYVLTYFLFDPIVGVVEGYEAVATTKGYCPAGTEDIGNLVPDDPTSVTDYQIDENLTIHCKKCDAGTYSPMRGSKCLPCPDDLPASVAGSTECSQCPIAGKDLKNANHFMKNGDPPIPCPCAAGWASNSDKTLCTICPQHSFSKNGKCVSCPDGKFTWGAGAEKCLQCMAEGADAGSYAFGRCHGSQAF